ncbi:MAG: aminotransferase class I/II-fold pyridoxal phosphate-dependent enzyme [Endozoicomonas sp. (ex Botrylloides leachii)]|nr:aminotransferase class I/II-fold pyridoxal phosphate-dependent enzyme [Endozoicomonas sp. (ex Botrylloides leachii)]
MEERIGEHEELIQLQLKDDRFLDISSFCKNIKKYPDLIYFCNPNNLTVIGLNNLEVREIVDNIKGRNTVLVLNEAYIEYSHKNISTGMPYFNEGNIIILIIFSNIYGLADLRIGYAIANQYVIDRLNYCRAENPYAVNNIAYLSAVYAINDQHHVEKSKEYNNQQKKYLYKILDDHNLIFYESDTNLFFYKGRWPELQARSRII